MKVLHLHASILYGGVETFLLTLIREKHHCPEMQHIFIACYESRFTEELRKLGAELVMVPPARYSRPWKIIQAQYECGKVIQKVKPDVIIAHQAKNLITFGTVARRYKVPIALYLHVPQTDNWVDKLSRFCPPDLMVGVSRHTVQTGKEILFNNVKNTVINYPMPFSVDFFDNLSIERDSVRDELGFAGHFIIMQATRMNAWKGHREIFDALALLKTNNKWRFALVGGPQNHEEEEYFADLKSYAVQLGISDNVLFLGQRRDVARIMVASDLYCQANVQSEGFSLSFTEAFSAGLPIVTTDIGSAQEIVSPEVGVLTPVQDAQALATALDAVMDNPARHQSMRNATRSHILKLSETGQQIRRLSSELSALLP